MIHRSVCLQINVKNEWKHNFFLDRYQKKYGSYCQYSECEKAVPHTSMGKYAVRFGLEARQFCSGMCLEEFKKILKSCGYCQKDVTQLVNTVRVTSDDKHSTKVN